MIYLDHNSTTNICMNATKAILEASNLGPLNPSSIHTQGRIAKNMLEQARNNILANFCALKNYDLLFTASGTEANNLVLKNFYQHHIFISAIEHLSLYQHIRYNSSIGIIKIDKSGMIDLHHLEELLQNVSGEKFLVSIIYANNETGVLQDLKACADIVKKHGGLLHSDFSQAHGKIPYELDKLELDFVTISGHKFGAPVGIAGLFYRKNLHLSSQMIGGGQEKGIRSGTENVIAAIGMAAASEKKTLAEDILYIQNLRQYLENQLRNICQDIKIASSKVARLCNTCNVTMPKVDNQLQLISFDLKGFALSAGSACSSGKISQSHVLKAYGYTDTDIKSSIRISLAKTNTLDEINMFCHAWSDIFENNYLK